RIGRRVPPQADRWADEHEAALHLAAEGIDGRLTDARELVPLDPEPEVSREVVRDARLEARMKPRGIESVVVFVVTVLQEFEHASQGGHKEVRFYEQTPRRAGDRGVFEREAELPAVAEPVVVLPADLCPVVVVGAVAGRELDLAQWLLLDLEDHRHLG